MSFFAVAGSSRWGSWGLDASVVVVPSTSEEVSSVGMCAGFFLFTIFSDCCIATIFCSY